MAKCLRCKGAEATVEITVEYYKTENNVILKDDQGIEVTETINNGVCKGCETFYKNYQDPQGRTLAEMPNNKSITYTPIT